MGRAGVAVRDYHSEIIHDFDCLVAAGVRSALLPAPTGCGKPGIAATIATSAIAAGQHLGYRERGPIDPVDFSRH